MSKNRGHTLLILTGLVKIWSESALAKTPAAARGEDGTLTYTIEIRRDLTFSDGSPITAKNYVAPLLANSTPVGAAAGGTGNQGNTLIGFDAFKAYDGRNAGELISLLDGQNKSVFETCSKTLKIPYKTKKKGDSFESPFWELLIIWMPPSRRCKKQCIL